MTTAIEPQERLVKAHCDKHGPYEQKVVDLFGKERVVGGCGKCAEEHDSQMMQAARKEAASMAEHEVRAVLPRRFHSCTFDGYESSNDGQRRALAICRKYVNRWDDRKAKGGSLVLCGKPGTGKTHLAAAIIREVVTAERVRDASPGTGMPLGGAPAKYVTASALARHVKSTYAQNAQETEASVISGYSRCLLLVIDEVGAQRGTETELLLLQEIIDNRYQNVLPTILISNLPESELSKYIGERALDRLYDNGGAVVAFDWESKRRAS